MKHTLTSARTLLALGLALVAGLGSCITPRGTAQNTYTSRTEGFEVEEDFGDPSFAKELVLEAVHTERRDGRLFAAFEIHNKRSSDLRFEWSLVWLDARGFPIDQEHPWTSAFLRGKGYETVTRTAPNSEATGFRLALSRTDSAH